MLIDTHCHLDFPDFDRDREEVLTRAKESGVGTIINVGSSLVGSRKSVALAAQYENIYAGVGIHPHDADTSDELILKVIEEEAASPKVVAIGEIGLDYFKDHSSRDNQKRVFVSLLAASIRLNLPVIVHTRQAEADTLDILKESRAKSVVIHCFSGDKDFLDKCLDRGYLVSFTCNITYKKSVHLRELLKEIPLEKLLLETDAPFLSPETLRGKRNEPAAVSLLAEEVARIRGVDKEQVGEQTTKNARHFFNL